MNKNLPIQAAPVERVVSPASVSAGSGVEASGFLSVLKSIGKVALPIATQLLSG